MQNIKKIGEGVMEGTGWFDIEWAVTGITVNRKKKYIAINALYLIIITLYILLLHQIPEPD